MPWLRHAGRAILWITSGLWLFVYSLIPAVAPFTPSPLAQWFTMAICFCGLSLWTVQTKHYACGLWTWGIAAGGAWLWLFDSELPLPLVLSSTGVVAGSFAIVAYVILMCRGTSIALTRFANFNTNDHSLRSGRVAAMLLPLADLATVHFASILALYYLPAMLWAIAWLDLTFVPAMWSWMLGLLVIAAMLFRGPLATVASVVLAPVAAGIAIGQWTPAMFTYDNLPLVFAITSSLMAIVMFKRSALTNQNLTHACSLWLYGLIALGFVSASPLTILSSLFAFATTYGLLKSYLSLEERCSFGVAASGLVILSSAMLSGYRGLFLSLVFSPFAPMAAAWITLMTIVAIIFFDHRWFGVNSHVIATWTKSLRLVGLVMGTVCFFASQPIWMEAILLTGFVLAAINEFRWAIRNQNEWHVHSGFALIASVVLWLHFHHAIALSPSVVRLSLFASGVVAMVLAKRWNDCPKLAIMVPSLQRFVIVIPLVISAGSLLNYQHAALESLAIFGAAIIWFIYGRIYQQDRFIVAAALVMNLGLGRLWYSLSVSDVQFYLVPLGLTVIGLVEMLRRDISMKAHDPLRYVGALFVLVSPCFDILGGSWLHMLSLMLLSVLVVLLSIGLRLRALVHAGTAFLLIDLVAMVIRTSIDNPGMLWGIGLLVGASVIAVAAICERHREQVLSRIRLLSAQLATWH